MAVIKHLLNLAGAVTDGAENLAVHQRLTQLNSLLPDNVSRRGNKIHSGPTNVSKRGCLHAFIVGSRLEAWVTLLVKQTLIR